jgi:hypothetical protein
MGYIIGIVLVLLILPLLFALLARRSAGQGGIDSRNHGMTVTQPSSDQPSPGARPASKTPSGSEGRIPPG